MPTFISIMVLTKNAFEEMVNSLFNENKEPPIIFNKNIAITRERPEFKKKTNLTIIRSLEPKEILLRSLKH